MTRVRHLRAILAVLVALAISAQLRAQSDAAEYRIKATFLFDFAKFVDWPADTFKDEKQPITFCTVGKDPFRGALDEVVSGKMSGNHSLRVRHYKLPQDILGCHILFIGSQKKKYIAEVLTRLKHAPVLTVGESDGFVQQGGMIGFVLEEDKLQFNVNLGAARAAQLKISSKLLSLANFLIVSSQGK
jgi:hypothetical protein